MRRGWVQFWIAFQLMILPALAQSVQGPVSAHVFDSPTGTFRVILGVPGFASLGPTLSASYEWGSVAPSGNHALAFRSGVLALLSELGNSASQSQDLAVALTSLPERVVWSADGSIAVLHSISGNWIQAIYGLPGPIRLGSRVEGGTLGGTITAVAVNAVDTGRMAIAVSGSGQAAVLVSDADGEVSLLGNVRARLLAFNRKGDCVIAWEDESESKSGKISVLPLPGSSSGTETWSAPGRDPIGLAVLSSVSGDRLAIINDSVAYLLDLATHDLVAEVALPLKPVAIERFGPNGLMFATTRKQGEPVWVLSMTPEPRVQFIPAGPGANHSGDREP